MIITYRYKKINYYFSIYKIRTLSMNYVKQNNLAIE